MVTGGKGYDLEELLKAYFQRSGYFVVRGLPYRVAGEEVTDIDLWLYERPAALTRRRIVVDAKNKKIPRAAERLVWTKGLQAALDVDAAIVASTDARAASRTLARELGVTLLDGTAISKLKQSPALRYADMLPSDGLDVAVRAVDKGRGNSAWRSALLSLRSALLTSFGIHSANTALNSVGFFGEETTLASPASSQANTGLRCLYYSAALASISLDFMLADLAFRSQEERRTAVVNAMRYGAFDASSALSTIRAATALIRQHVENGSAAARQVERGFSEQAEKVPSEIIADFVSRGSVSENLFPVARELEAASNKSQLPAFDDLSVEARSALGTYLDFASVPRIGVAAAWPKGTTVLAPIQQAGPPGEPGLL